VDYEAAADREQAVKTAASVAIGFSEGTQHDKYLLSCTKGENNAELLIVTTSNFCGTNSRQINATRLYCGTGLAEHFRDHINPKPLPAVFDEPFDYKLVDGEVNPLFVNPQSTGKKQEGQLIFLSGSRLGPQKVQKVTVTTPDRMLIELSLSAGKGREAARRVVDRLGLSFATRCNIMVKIGYGSTNDKLAFSMASRPQKGGMKYENGKTTKGAVSALLAMVKWSAGIEED